MLGITITIITSNDMMKPPKKSSVTTYVGSSALAASMLGANEAMKYARAEEKEMQVACVCGGAVPFLLFTFCFLLFAYF